MKLDYLVNRQKGIHSVKKGKERVAVGSLWSIEVPAGYSYCADTSMTATDINDVHYLLQIQKTDDCDFSDGYSSDVSVTVRDVLYFLDSYHEDARKQMDQFDQIAQQLSIAMGGYELIRAEKDILIGRAEDTLFSYSFMYFILTGGTNSILTLQITFATDTPSDEAERIGKKLVDSIEPITVEDYVASEKLIELDGTYRPDFDDTAYVALDEKINIPIPKGFEYNQPEDTNFKLFIAPIGFDFNEDITNAKLSLAIEQSNLDFTGSGRSIKDTTSWALDYIRNQAKVDWFNSGAYIERSTGKSLILFACVSNDERSKTHSPFIINNGEKIYFGHVCIHYENAKSVSEGIIWDAKTITALWLSNILFKGEKTRRKVVAAKKQDYSSAVPDKSLYPHYDHIMNAALMNGAANIPGVTVVVNQSGTEYEFCSLRSILDSADEMDDANQALIKRIIDQDSDRYDFDEKATAMSGLFRVDKDAFDARNDRESEIACGYIKKAYMFNALRSFAWTLEDYCNKNNMQPHYVNITVLKELIEFIAKRKWLNYDDKGYCKGLCAGSDLHVYYVPDTITKEDRKKLQPSKDDYDRVETIKSKLPSYNDILVSIQSLDSLREAIKYVYPAIETLYKDLAKGRDTFKPLEGNEADIVYAWCSLAKAAKEPFFSEDGPMTCFFEQQDTETNLNVLEEADEVKMFVILTNEKKMGKDNRKPNDFFKEYGRYFAALNKKEMLALRETVLDEMSDEEYCKKSREAFMKKSVENRFIVATIPCFNATELGDFSQKADEAIEKTKDWYAESEVTEARKLMNAELDRIKAQIDKRIKAVYPEWAEWSTAKQYLKVFVRQKNDPRVELKDDCKLFQVERRETILDDPKIVIEVFLCMDGSHRIRVTDGMPMYWGVSYIDVWKAARKNEIVDKVNCYGDLQAKDAMSKIRKKYPDAALLKQRQKAAEKAADEAEQPVPLSELDTLCMYAIVDYEKNCGKKVSASGVYGKYKDNTNCFKKLKKKQIGKALEEMEETVSKNMPEVKEYEAGFKALSVDERFEYITRQVFEHSLFGYADQQREKYIVEALEFTGKWYDPCELVYAEKKLTKLLQDYGAEIDKRFMEDNTRYMEDYNSLRKNLVIELKKNIIKKNGFAQIDDGEYRCEIKTKTGFGGIFSVYYNEALPWYWGVSKAEVWENAFRNTKDFIAWNSSLKDTITSRAEAKRIVEKYVRMASKDTYVPDNPYDRNVVYAEIEPYDEVVKKVEKEYGQVTPDTMKSFLEGRDSEIRLEIEKKAAAERIEVIKMQARDFEKKGSISNLNKALELYKSIEKEADVKNEILNCENRIRTAKQESEQKLHYKEGKRLEADGTISSLKHAASQYELAEDYEDAAKRAAWCLEQAQTIREEARQELSELQAAIAKLKAKHAQLGGFLKKKQRLEVEESIRFCEQKIKENKQILEE